MILDLNPRPLHLALLSLLTCTSLVGQDFRETSKISQLVGEVTEGQTGVWSHAAQIDDEVNIGNVVITGADSRAELTAADTTVIRIGANSVFSFSDQSREMILDQGSILFHTPHRQGGGIIKTAAVTASVTGSTVAVSTTLDGGVKVVPLESACTVTDTEGHRLDRLTPGQMLAISPGQPPVVVSIDLDLFTHSSGLIKNFPKPLEPKVQNKIDLNVTKQVNHIQERTGIDITNTVVSNNLTKTLATPVVEPPREILSMTPTNYAPQPIEQVINIDGLSYLGKATFTSSTLNLTDLKPTTFKASTINLSGASNPNPSSGGSSSGESGVILTGVKIGDKGGLPTQIHIVQFGDR